MPPIPFASVAPSGARAVRRRRPGKSPLLAGMLALACCAGCSGTASAGLEPFTTDGCSAFPDGTFEQQKLWLNCCVVHDFAYWQGGSYEQRRQADEELKTCVAKVGEPTIASLMLAGVRAGGTPYLPTRFRWAYGWPYLRGYKALTAAELEQVREQSADALRTMQQKMAGDGQDRPQ